MNKKLLSLVLSLVMVLGTFTSVFANEPAKTDDKAEKAEKVEKIVGKSNKVQYLIDKKFVEGNEKGDYELDSVINRAQITKIIVLANGQKELAEKLAHVQTDFKDVKTDFWANGFIAVGSTQPSAANNQKMLQGYPDGNFLPEKGVSYAELAKMLVVVGKDDLTADMVKEANKSWPSIWVSYATKMGIFDDVNVTDYNKEATREDAFTMMYNTLYKMEYLKRQPVNEVIGVISKLSNKKLTLNQDSFKKEFDITDDTVFVKNDVNGKAENGNKNVVTVSTLKNAEFYKGSLVRIIYNDKNEVTHMLELGNPENGALAGKNDKNSSKTDLLEIYDGNDRWDNVADATVSTKMYKNIKSAKDADIVKIVDGKKSGEVESYATLTFKKSDDSEVNGIKFNYLDKDENGKYYINDKNELEIKDDDLKVYLANPANNQMTEVKDIYEAIRLLGYKNTDKIPNVYVGYDDNSTDTAVGTLGTDKQVKIIVFNVVTKDNDLAQKYRVVQSTDSKGDLVLQDVNGKEYDVNEFDSTSRFPFSNAKLLWVVEYKYDATDDSYDWEAVIKHDKTDRFPIVKITDEDGDIIEVEDKNGNKTLLNIKDADVFVKKDLKEGAKIQYALDEKEDGKNIVSAVSVLKDAKSLEGTLSTDVDNDKNTNFIIPERSVMAEVKKVNVTDVIGEKSAINYKEYESLMSTKVVDNVDGEKIETDLAKGIEKLLADKEADKKVQLLLQFNKDKDVVVEAYTVEINGAIVKFTAVPRVKVENSKEKLRDAIVDMIDNAKTANDDLNLAKVKKALDPEEYKKLTLNQLNAIKAEVENNISVDAKMQKLENDVKNLALRNVTVENAEGLKTAVETAVKDLASYDEKLFTVVATAPEDLKAKEVKVTITVKADALKTPYTEIKEDNKAITAKLDPKDANVTVVQPDPAQPKNTLGIKGQDVK